MEGRSSTQAGRTFPDYGTLGRRLSGSWIKKLNDRFGFALGLAHQRQKNAYPSYQAWGFNTGGLGQDNLPAGGGDLTGNGDFGYVPWGVQTEVKKLTTDRNAALGVLEFKPSDALSIKLDSLYTAFKIDEEQNQTWYQGIGNWDNGQAGKYSNATIVDHRAVALTANEWTGNIRNVLAAYSQDNSVFSTGLNAEYSGLASWMVKADLAYSNAKTGQLLERPLSGRLRQRLLTMTCVARLPSAFQQAPPPLRLRPPSWASTTGTRART